MKRIPSAVIVICMLLMNMINVIAAQDYAMYVFGGELTNISSFSGSGGTMTQKGNRKAFYMDGKNAKFMVINLDDDFIYTPKGDQAVIVTVEYYDEGNGKFTIAYDGVNNIQYDIMQTEGDIVQLNNTKTWKSYEFYLEDAKLANTYLNNVDFRIGLWSNTMGTSPEGVSFGSVRVEKTYMRNPVKATLNSEYYGNIFGPNDDKTLTLDFENIAAAEVEAIVNYTVTDENGEQILSGKFNEVFAAKQKRSEEIDISQISKFGLYTMNVVMDTEQTYNGEVKTNKTQKSFSFSFINKPTMLSDKQFVATHGTKRGIEHSAKIASYAGFGGVRDEIEWNKVEVSKGVFKVPKRSDDYVTSVKQSNLDYFLILDYGNLLYDSDSAYPGNTKIAPYTDEGIAAYANYCAYMAEKYKGVINNFEIWNEYNIKNFNPREENGAMYAKMLKAAYTAIKAVNPDAVVAGMATAGADTDFMGEVLKAGGYDYMDVVSCHPYDWSGSFRIQNYIDRINKVKLLFRAYGGEKPIWLSEMGISSADNGSTGVSEKEQAINAIQMYVVSQEEKLCERIYWYDLVNDGTSREDGESCFGIVRAPEDENSLAAKPVMAAMAGMNTFLADAEASGKKKYGSSTAYKFTKANGDEIYVVWSLLANEEAIFNFASDKVNVYDMYTNKINVLENADGVYEITTGKTPIYIEVKKVFAAGTNLDNVVKEKDNISLGISMKNETDESIFGTLNWGIYNSKGVLELSGSNEKTINVNQHLIFGINAGKLKSGNYKVKLEYDTEKSIDTAAYNFSVK